MTPPGDGLDFHVSPTYRFRLRFASELDLAIRQELRNRPNGGSQVEGILREMNIAIGAVTYVVFFTRERNKVGLTAVFDVSDEAMVAAHREALKLLFKTGGGK